LPDALPIFAVAGQVHIHLASPDVETQARKGNVPKIQVALPRCHLHAQLQRKSLAETQIPFVSRIAKVNGVRVLGDRDFTDAIGDVIIDARFIVAVRKPEIGIERVRGIAADGEFACADVQYSIDATHSSTTDTLSSRMS